MRQLPLVISEASPTLATFVSSSNEELLTLLELVSRNDNKAADQQVIYLWGDSGCGKTHLLKALHAARPDSVLLTPELSSRDFDHKREQRLYLVDDCDRLNARQQVAAFNLFNQVREHGGTFVASGRCAPAGLPLREDLRTRLGWGLVYQVHALTDEQKMAALERAAQARGFQLAAGVLPWLITHYKRDMSSLSALLDALDRYSLETKRAVTLPLVRELLQLNEQD